MDMQVIAPAHVLEQFLQAKNKVGGNPFYLIAEPPAVKPLDAEDKLAGLFIGISDGTTDPASLPSFASQNWPAEQRHALALDFMRKHIRDVEARAQRVRTVVAAIGCQTESDYMKRVLGFFATVKWSDEEGENGVIARFEYQHDKRNEAKQALVQVAQKFPGLTFCYEDWKDGKKASMEISSQGIREFEKKRSAAQILKP